MADFARNEAKTPLFSCKMSSRQCHTSLEKRLRHSASPLSARRRPYQPRSATRCSRWSSRSCWRPNAPQASHRKTPETPCFPWFSHVFAVFMAFFQAFCASNGLKVAGRGSVSWAKRSISSRFEANPSHPRLAPAIRHLLLYHTGTGHLDCEQMRLPKTPV